MYDALQEALLSGETTILASEFRKEFVRLCKLDGKSSKTKLAKQFEVC